MEYNELYHWGVKGMKWGVRRFQNEDGSLTPAGKKRYAEDAEYKKEIDGQRREKALKSTNAEEVYKNRDVLTTAELNERINRINAEQNLANLSNRNKKSGYDFVDKALKLGRKVNEVYEFTNTPVMKALKKQLRGEAEKKGLSPDINKLIKNFDKMTDSEVANALKRLNSEKAIRKMYDEMKAEANKSSNHQKESSSERRDNPGSSAKTDTFTGYSKENVNKARKPQKDVTVDADYTEINNSGKDYATSAFKGVYVSDLPAVTTQSGKLYIEENYFK